jgi:hypothetical protein
MLYFFTILRPHVLPPHCSTCPHVFLHHWELLFHLFRSFIGGSLLSHK